EVPGDLHPDGDVLVPPAAAVEDGDALPPQAEGGARLGARLHFALDLPVQGGDLNLSTHGGLVDRHRLVQVDVTALPAQPGVGHHVDAYDKVPGGAAVAAHVSLASDGDGLAIVDAGGDFDVDLLLPAHTAAAAAGLALLMDDLPLAPAVGADGGGGHGAEHRPLLDPHLAAAVALGADLRSGPR